MILSILSKTMPQDVSSLNGGPAATLLALSVPELLDPSRLPMGLQVCSYMR